LTEEQAAERFPTDIYLAKFTPMRHTLTGRHARTVMKLVVEQSSQKIVGAHMSVAGRFRTFAGTRSGDKVRRLQTFPPSHRNQEVRPLRVFLTQVCGRLV
jgi:Pyridine nucleotide-disulphide oxidoreductase, dimerisation domain